MDLAYSSSTGAGELAAAEDFAIEAARQPAPRRRYGRPNYSDKMHNADGSNKIALRGRRRVYNPCVRNPSTKYLNTSWKIQGGVGYNFNKNFGVILQFDYDNFGLPGSLIASQQAVYTGAELHLFGWDCRKLCGPRRPYSRLVVYAETRRTRFYQGESTGAYAVVGGGFYHKVTDFTLPTTGTYCDFYYGCYQYHSEPDL